MLTGLPPGVVNLVFGTGPKAGAPIVRHPDIPVISFTGSTATGQTITEMSAPFYKKLSLEVSSKSESLLHVHVLSWITATDNLNTNFKVKKRTLLPKNYLILNILYFKFQSLLLFFLNNNKFPSKLIGVIVVPFQGLQFLVC